MGRKSRYELQGVSLGPNMVQALTVYTSEIQQTRVVVSPQRT
jgi:hypothetical protein